MERQMDGSNLTCWIPFEYSNTSLSVPAFVTNDFNGNPRCPVAICLVGLTCFFVCLFFDRDLLVRALYVPWKKSVNKRYNTTSLHRSHGKCTSLSEKNWTWCKQEKPVKKKNWAQKQKLRGSCLQSAAFTNSFINQVVAAAKTHILLRTRRDGASFQTEERKKNTLKHKSNSLWRTERCLPECSCSSSRTPAPQNLLCPTAGGQMWGGWMNQRVRLEYQQVCPVVDGTELSSRSRREASLFFWHLFGPERFSHPPCSLFTCPRQCEQISQPRREETKPGDVRWCAGSGGWRA